MDIRTINGGKNNVFLHEGKLISCSKRLHCRLEWEKNVKVFVFSLKNIGKTTISSPTYYLRIKTIYKKKIELPYMVI
jgi:hypothetical protein